MGEDSPPAAAARYRAFISYSHADAKFAGWLHRKLESWRLPDKSRLAPVFIDRAELAAGSDLSAQVQEALGESGALVVVCSPNAVASRWVGQEIALFRQLHPTRPVLAALIDGEPGEAFPAPLTLLDGRTVEPLAADFREGHDGKRLGLIKIVAGLTALPLDRLVQRDAQNRQRRVMAVTAGALLLSLVLSTSLVFALRARAEAERQRSEAEGLVEFMLTDLRDKLKGVGRLDVMDAVNQRAMAHYGDTSYSELQTETELRHRAQLYAAMAEDDLSTAGRAEAGGREALFSLQLSQVLVKKYPNSTENLFTLAQSQFWIGYYHYNIFHKQQAIMYWNDYRLTAERLTRLEPANVQYQSELAYSESNLCSAELLFPSNGRSAIHHCEAAIQVSRRISSANPKDLQHQIDLFNRLGWLADAQKSIGNHTASIELRNTPQRAIVDSIVRLWPNDIRSTELRLRFEVGLALALQSGGKLAEAKQHAKTAMALARELRAHDPKNQDWVNWMNQAQKISLK